MNETQRKRAFALAALCLMAVVAAISALGGGEHPTRRPAPAGSSLRPVVLGETTAPARRPSPRSHNADDEGARAARNEDLAPGARRPPRATRPARRVHARARAFAGAYLRFEAGGSRPRARRVIEASASVPLAHSIVSQAPRAIRGRPLPSPGRLVELNVELVGPSRAEVTAAIARRQRRSALFISLRRGPSGWLVTDLG